MASALCRTGSNIIRRCALMSGARASSGGGAPVDHHKGKVASDKVSMPDGLGHAVGPERFELLAKLAGNEDPFEMEVKKRGISTFEEPNIVRSLYDRRLVGCVCEEDAVTVCWWYINKGEPKRCECGHWFRLDPLEVPDYS